jgi:2TM domain-containing protein
MENKYPMEHQAETDKDLWRVARRRVSFKRHLGIYVIINLFLWAIWWFTDHRNPAEEDYSGVPWPVFPTLGWGIAVLMSFLGAYVFYNKRSSVEKEYEKLKSK